jgi:hypothetical protein
MKYLPLLTISLKHTFYDSGNCPDFSVTPNAETARLLNNHRCIIKPNAFGLSIYVPVDKQIPLISFDKNDQFLFDLNLQTDEFALYSDQQIQLSSPKDCKLYQDGKLVEGNLFDWPKAKKPLLNIAIQRDFSQIKAVPSTDEIQFEAKPVFWFYYVVTDPSKNGNKSLAIEDADKKTTWKQLKPLANDSIYAQLTQQYPGKTIVCFISDQALACQQSCTRHLKLKQDGHTIFEQLPGPSYRNHFRMEANKGSNPSDVIYEIVKYFTNTPSIKG